jgi:hypothetical protein
LRASLYSADNARSNAQTSQGNGGTTQTLKLANIQGNLALTVPDGILAQLPAGDFKTQLTQLAAQPGHAWLNQLAQNQNVNWQQVALAHDQWQST